MITGGAKFSMMLAGDNIWYLIRVYYSVLVYSIDYSSILL